jgi:hypothetical protein
MAKLSDTQLVILSTACQRDDRLVLPLPDRLKGGAANKVISSLIAKGLVEEIPAALDQPVWRKTEDEQRLTLIANQAAFAELGTEPDEEPSGEPATAAVAPADNLPTARTAPAARKTREGSKQARLVEMLKRPEGVTIAEAAEALEWQSHTVRGALAGALKKKLGLTINSQKVESRGRVYRIGK